MTYFHPQKNSKGEPVEIRSPHEPSSLDDWADRTKRATAVPGCGMPASICGIPVSTSPTPYETDADWDRLAKPASFDEPPFHVRPGMKPASGAVVIEADGRVWVVSPSNQFAGYSNTFPKGSVPASKGTSLRANAIKEVYEESGLLVELIGFLADSERTMTTTRYYLGRRIGGNPADMGWESQAVHLVPASQLAEFVNHVNDGGLIKALGFYLNSDSKLKCNFD